MIAIAGGRIGRGRGEAILAEGKKLAVRLGVEILLMNADLVFGKDHVESAIEHAERAFKRGTNVATSKMMEVMLYASGERQLSTAIKKLGLKKGTTRVVLVVSDSRRVDEVLRDLKVSRDDSVLEGRAEKLRAFGLSQKALGSVAKGMVLDLVLERVALVDTLK